MFKVRREQMQAYREAALRDFEDRMVAHVERCFPQRLTALGAESVREVIRLGIERAAGHGIVTERDVCKFIDLMLVLGPTFDEEPWAREILVEPNRGSWRKLDELFELAGARLQAAP